MGDGTFYVHRLDFLRGKGWEKTRVDMGLGEGGLRKMINNENGIARFEKAEKVEAFNCERCDQEMLAEHANDWLRPDHPDGEKVKLCNSCYGLIAVIDEK